MASNPSRAAQTRGKPVKFPWRSLQQAVELRESDPARSTFQLLATLERLHPEYKGKVKRSTLARHFQQLGKTRQALRKEPKAGYRHFRKRHRNDLWETDICLPDLQVRDTDGQVKKAVLVAILDNATGFCVGAEFHTTQDGGVVESCLKKALTAYGLPLAIYQDNGAQIVGVTLSQRAGGIHKPRRPP